MDKNIEPVSDSIKQDELGWSSLSVHTYVKTAIIAILLYVYFSEAIIKVVGKWSDPSWSHGFLIPLFSLYFLNQHKSNILSVKMKSDYVGLLLLTCCLVFYPLNIFIFKIAYFEPLTVIAAIGACVLFFGGWKLIRFTWLPVVYLIFAVPLPARFQTQLTMPLRLLAAQISTMTLNLVNGMEATARGAVIDVVYKGQPLDPPLDVAEACSGMRLLMAFVALGVAMAYLHYRPVWQRGVLLASTIPIAVVCNIVRVTITGFIYILGDPKYAKGIYHDGLGMLMLPLAFGMYGAIAWFMENLLEDESVATGNDAGAKSSDDDVIVRRK